MSFTEKHKAFHDKIMVCIEIDQKIKEHENAIEALRINQRFAEEQRDAAASEAAEEKIAAGLAGIEMPDGTYRLCEKTRRGKKTAEAPEGTAPKHPFKVSEKVLR
jgi:predicted transcriptional regulator YdeE